MKTWQLIQSNSKLGIRLGITVGLATLFLAALLWVSTSGAPAVASPPVAQMDRALNGGAVITIGVASSQSAVPDFGWRQTNAVQLAISQTNAAGGIEIGGTSYMLELVTADSACNSVDAVTAANTLLDAGAVAVVGHTCSGASFAAQGIYDAAGVPMVSPSSSAIGLTEQGYSTTLRVFARDDAQAVLMATYFRESLRMDAVALVEWSGYEFSTDAFSNTFTGLGGTITIRHSVTYTDEYTATLTLIQAGPPDAVFYADSDANQAGFFSSVAHSLGLSIVGWDAIWSDSEAAPGDYAAAAGSAAEGDYAGLNGRRTDNMPGYDDFNLAYQAASFPSYGDESKAWGAFAYDDANIIIAAIKHADSVNPGAIRDEIAATVDYDGVVGTYEGFDAKGDVIPQWSWLELYQNGEWVMVYSNRVFLPLVLNNFQ